MVYPENAEVHIMADEKASRAYIEPMWAEAMVIYQAKSISFPFQKKWNNMLCLHT